MGAVKFLILEENLKMKKLTLYPILIFSLFLFGCSGKQNGGLSPKDKQAMAMLEGIWVDASEEDVSFSVKGDTIYFPDSITRPVEFKIIGDSLILNGSNTSKYRITRQGENFFEFDNGSGGLSRFLRSENPSDSLLFNYGQSVVVNQSITASKDSIVSFKGNKYRCSIKVSPTKTEVYKSRINDDGLEVESVFYDNMVHLSIHSSGDEIFSKDFLKSDFEAYVPSYMLTECILSNITLSGVDDKGFHFLSQMAIPDSPSSFIVEFVVSFKGKVTF